MPVPMQRWEGEFAPPFLGAGDRSPEKAPLLARRRWERQKLRGNNLGLGAPLPALLPSIWGRVSARRTRVTAGGAARSPAPREGGFPFLLESKAQRSRFSGRRIFRIGHDRNVAPLPDFRASGQPRRAAAPPPPYPLGLWTGNLERPGQGLPFPNIQECSSADAQVRPSSPHPRLILAQSGEGSQKRLFPL